VGVGVGYTAAARRAEVVGETNVHAVDISRPLVVEARENLADAGYDGVLVDCRDGATGFPSTPLRPDLIRGRCGRTAPRPARATRRGRATGLLRGTQRQRLEAVSTDGVVDRFDPVSFDPLLVEGEQSGAVERNR